LRQGTWDEELIWGVGKKAEEACSQNFLAPLILFESEVGEKNEGMRTTVAKENTRMLEMDP
jgi:hypothetical protein